MKRTILITALVSLALLPAFAQDASSDFDAPASTTDTAAAPAFNWGTLKYSGDQDFAWRFGAYDPATRTGGAMDSKMAAEYKLGGLKVVAAGQVKENEFVPGETAAFYTLGPVKFGLGYQEFSWGVADKKNPTDTLNARDYRFGPNADRLVNPAASVALYPTDWMSLEAVYEPWKEETKFPTDFQVKTQEGLTKKATDLKTSAVAALFSTYMPVATTASFDRNFDNPVYGGRANFFLPGLDLSLSYLYDRDSFYTPVVTMKSYLLPAHALLATTGVDTPAMNLFVPNTIELVNKRVHRFGLNAKTTIDKYGLWLESAYNKTEASSNDDSTYDNRHDSIDWTTGFDFNFGPGSNYYLNVQYAGEWVLGYDASTVKDYPEAKTTAEKIASIQNMANQDYMAKATYRSMVQTLGSQSEQMMNTLTGNIKFPLADATITPQFSAAVIVPYNYDDTKVTRLASAYLNPEVDFAPVDGVHLLFGADLNYGWVKTNGSSDVTLDTTTDKLGLYTPQNNVYVKVKFAWNGTVGNQ
jgi:hypothetical protein